MKVSLSWLRELVAIGDVPFDDLTTRLSMLGLKVEEVVRTGEGIEGVVVGRVLEVRDHPTSNKPLVLVKADVGTGEPLDIVCGARNFGAGDVVPVAVPGSKLPGGFEITRRKLAGEVSNGMLCSARELGVSDDHAGIMLLDPALALGEDVRSVLELDDTILDLDVTPNRPDCLSVLGIARDLSAAFGVPLTLPEIPGVEQSGEPVVPVSIEDTGACSRYVARIVRGADASGSSPWWMRRRLLAAGVRPISAVVDITNYVMLELGQPLHAFDLAKLRGPAIVVRLARDGETIVTLDDAERTLTAADLVICDAEGVVAIAGVMGGAGSEVSSETTDILIESASFDPTRVLRTARRLGLRTEASVRFERGVDTDGQRRAADRAAGLIASLCGGTIAGGAEAGPGAEPVPAIRLSVAKANALLGTDVPADRMREMLDALGCRVETAGGDAFTVTAPSWRPDLRIEEDLAEEIARLHGFDAVPVTLPAGGRRGGLSREQALRRLARRTLLGAGLSEAQTLSLVNPATFDRLGLPADHQWRRVVRVANPLSDEDSVLRSSLLPGLLLAAQRNVARRTLSVALFEEGVRFAPGGGDLPDETREIAWVLTGPRPLSWHAGDPEFDLFDAKGIAEALAAALGVEDLAVEPAELGAPFHPARSGVIRIGGTEAGLVAELHPRAASALDLPGRVAVGVVRVGALVAAARDSRTLPLPRHPAVLRDVALVVPATERSSAVRDAIREAAGPLLEDVTLFDVYRDERLGEGNVSLAFTMRFRHDERTLADTDVDEAYASVAGEAARRGWTIRS